MVHGDTDMATGEPWVERSHEEDVRYLLKRLALEVTPEGTLEALATRIGVHPTTLSSWRGMGDVPAAKARWLQRIFGHHAPAARLCKEIRETHKTPE